MLLKKIWLLLFLRRSRDKGLGEQSSSPINTQSSELPAPDMEFAFEVAGRKFYRFREEKGIFVERALSAMDVYAELDTKIDREYLELYFKSILELLNKGKLVEAGSLTKMAQSRLKHITNVGLVYKLASIVFIEQGEDPCRYNLAVGEEKIKFWQAHEKDIDAFFFKMRIGELIPYLDTYEGSMQEYSQAQSEELSRQYEYLTNILLQANESGDLKNILNSLKDKNSAILNLSNSQ